MNSLLAAEGRKLNSGAGGLGGGISRRVFSNCLRKASLAAAWRLAGESFTLTTDMLLLPEEEPFRLDDEAFKNREGKRTDQGKLSVQIRLFQTRVIQHFDETERAACETNHWNKSCNDHYQLIIHLYQPYLSKCLSALRKPTLGHG